MRYTVIYLDGGTLMRISTKGRYALAAAVYMAQQHPGGDCITAASISEKLGISKIYLEQVFSLLKHGSIVVSVKGAQGGYMLSRAPANITVFEVLASAEAALSESAEDTVPEKAPDIERAMRKTVLDALDGAIRDTLSHVTLEDLTGEAQKYNSLNANMFYI
jgi:Rrf2 family protein